jgi:nucleoid-associated protein YejK
MSQQQAEQSQQLLSRLQQQMEEEANRKQQMLINHMHIIAKIQVTLIAIRSVSLIKGRVGQKIVYFRRIVNAQIMI